MISNQTECHQTHLLMLVQSFQANMPITINLIPAVIATTSLIRIYFLRKKLLLILLTLEFTVLRLFLLTILTLNIFNQTPSIAFFLLTLGACEARLGLSLIVTIVRFKGNDMLRITSSFSC